MATKDINDPFIKEYMTNPVAKYLIKQQKEFDNYYGEVFVTNKYGVMIATTNKLTILAHSHKYWWKGAYNNGRGRIYFDDRGYDISAKGYVLGVVVPIKKDGELIGLIKANIKILGPYSNLINKYSEKYSGNISLVRSRGRIIIKDDIEPLSEALPIFLVNELKNGRSNTKINQVDAVKIIYSYSPVKITQGNDKYGFGSKTNQAVKDADIINEKWFVIVSRDVNDVLSSSRKTSETIILIGIIFTLIIVIAALIIGKRITSPIIKLTKKIGEGD